MQPTIRRHSNGTINIGYYRTLAERMRRDASIDMMRHAGPVMGMMTVCAALLLAVAVFGGHHATPQQIAHAAPMTQTVQDP